MGALDELIKSKKGGGAVSSTITKEAPLEKEGFFSRVTKGIARTLLPKSWEYKLGITELPTPSAPTPIHPIQTLPGKSALDSLIAQKQTTLPSLFEQPPPESDEIKGTGINYTDLKSVAEKQLQEIETRLSATKEQFERMPTGGIVFPERGILGIIKDILPPSATQKKINVAREIQNLSVAADAYREFLTHPKEDVGFFRGAIRGIKDQLKEGIKLIPFYGSTESFNELITTIGAYKKKETGQAVTPLEESLIKKYQAKNLPLDKGMGYAVGSTIAQLPTFATEFAMLGGVYTATEKAVTTGLMKVGLPKLVAKSAGFVLGGAAQGLVNIPEVSERTAQYMLPQQDIVAGENGDYLISEVDKNGDSFEKALTKAFGTTIVDYVTERTGVVVEKPLGFLQRAVLGKWLAKKGISTLSQAGQTVKKAIAWNGIIGEVFEEELAELFQAPIEGRPYKPPLTTPEGTERLLVETLAIGAFGGLGKISDVALRQIQGFREKEKPKPIDITPPAPPAPPAPPTVPIRPTWAEVSAGAIERRLVGEEKFRKTEKQAELLRQKLTQEEKESGKLRLSNQIDSILKNILSKPATQRTVQEKELVRSGEEIKEMIKPVAEVKPEIPEDLGKNPIFIKEAEKITNEELMVIDRRLSEVGIDIDRVRLTPPQMLDAFHRYVEKAIPLPKELKVIIKPEVKPEVPFEEGGFARDFSVMSDNDLLLEQQDLLEKTRDETLLETEQDKVWDRLDIVNAELEKRGLIKPPEDYRVELIEKGMMEPETDEDYKKGFEAEGRGEAKFDDNNQVFHSTESVEEIPDIETKNRVSALKQPLTQLGYVINLIRAGKTVPEDLRWVIDNYIQETRQNIGVDIAEDLGNGKYKLIFSDEALSQEALDEFFSPELYKDVTDYTKLQEGYGIEIAGFEENDVVKVKTDEGQRWGRLIDIFDNGRAIVETSTGEVEVDFWSLTKPSKLTKEQEKIAEGIFPKETIGQVFELTPDFMKKKGIEPPPERPARVRRVPARNINSRIFDIVKIGTLPKASLPIVQKIAIKGNKIFSTDLETALVYEADKNIGEIVLSPENLKGVSLEEIEIDTKKQVAKIGGTEIKAFASIKDFPIVPQVKAEPQLMILPSTLIEQFEKILPAVSKSDIRPEIGGIFVKNEGGRLRIVGTDSFRLYQTFSDGKVLKDFEGIIPRSAAERLIKILKQSKTEERIEISFEKIKEKTLLIKFKFGNFSFISRLIDGEFPNYKTIIPKEFKNQVIIDREEFLSALNEAPKNRLNEVKMKLDEKNKKIVLFYKTEEISFEKDLAVEFVPKPKNINPDSDLYIVMPIDTDGVGGYNVNYLMTFLRKAKSSEIELSNVLIDKSPTILQETDKTLRDEVRENIAKYGDNSIKELKKPPEFRKSNIKLRLKEAGNRFYVKNSKIESANDVADIFSELKKESREKSFVLNLTKNNEIINIGLISIGSIDAALINPEEILKSSVNSKADKAYFIHNHPSGDTRPSEDDIILIRRIQKVLAGSGISLEGAIIINHTEYGYFDKELNPEVVRYTPRSVGKKEIPVTELIQIIKDSEAFIGGEEAFVKPKIIARFFSEIINPKVPIVVLLNFNSRNKINGYDIIGSSFDDIPALKKRIAKSISRYNPAAVALASNVLNVGELDQLKVFKLGRYVQEIGIRFLDAVFIGDNKVHSSYLNQGLLSEENLRVAENVVNYGEFSEEEQAVIKAITDGLPVPIELSKAVKSLQEKGVIQTGKPKKVRAERVRREKPPTQPFKLGERISMRGITLSRSRDPDKVRPYTISYRTGEKSVVKTFENLEDARRRFDIMTEIRARGFTKRGELPEELQPSQEQKATAHMIAHEKKITPRQYRRIALAYTGVDSMKKMTPEQATEFIKMMREFKPKFGGQITIPRTKEIVTQQEAERKFRDIKVGWLLDIFRSPANQFRRIGLGKESTEVYEGFRLKRDFVNKWFSKFNEWQKELGITSLFSFFQKRKITAQSRRLFQAINNPEKEIELTEQEVLMVGRARILANEVADLVDDARAEIGLEPMHRRQNYITNLLTDESHFLILNTKQAPNELYALLDIKMPASVFNRLLLERKGGLPIKEDFWQALKAMVQIHGKYIHLNPPVHRLERFMRFYGDKIPVLSRVYIRSRVNRFLGRPGTVDRFLRGVDEVVTQTIAKIPFLSKKVEIEFQSGLTEIIEVPRLMLKPMKVFQLLKAVRYVYDLAFSVSFYTINLTQFFLNTIPKLRGNVIDIYQSAFTGYGQMMVDFFRPSKWEYWREKGVLTEIDNVIDLEFSAKTKLGGDVLNLFAKLSEFNNRVASVLATEKNLQLLAKRGKFGMLYKELSSAFGDEARDYARHISDITQFRYGIEEKPIFFDNPILNLYYQYNTFALKQIEFTEEMARNLEAKGIIKDFRQAVREGKTKEFIANLTQGQRGEFIRFVINIFILSLILGWSYIWEAVFKGIVPNQVEGVWKILKGFWSGDKKLRAKGYRQVLAPPAYDLIEKVADYGIIATIKSFKAVKQLDLIRIMLTGEGELRTIEGKVKEKITSEVAIGRLLKSTKEESARVNQKGWDLYGDITRRYNTAREEAIKLIVRGETEKAKTLARNYNKQAKIDIQKLKDLGVTDLRLLEYLKSISKSKIVSLKDFQRWVKDAKKNY